MTSGTPSDDDDRTLIAPGFESGTVRPSSDTQHALVPGTRLAEFEIIAPIGQGGFSIVYLAHDTSLGRKVALKEYLPAAFAVRRDDMTVSVIAQRFAETFQAGLRSFVNEAQLLARFDHPSLVKVYRFWQANGTAYMVMPYYEGATLKEALRDMGHPPDEAWLRNIVSQLLEALSVIHAERCFHRDIAPDNILLLAGNRPVLLDFGAARRAISDMAQAMTVIVKPGYAPIEQYGESTPMKQGAWTDLYALASVMYFAIMGRPPTPAVERIMSDPLVPLAQAAAGRYDDRFLRGIDAALAVKPEDRPQTIAEFRELLRLPERPRGHGDERVVAGDDGEKRSFPWKYALSAAALITIVVAGGVAYHYRPQPAPLTEQAKTPADRTAPPVTVKFEPSRVLDVVFDGRDPAAEVTVAVEKQRLRIGKEHPKFTLQSRNAGYVYLLMLDSTQSNVYLVFPNASDRDNRIEAQTPLRLPRKGWPLELTGPAGIDRFVAVVSETPRQLDAQTWEPVDIFKQFPLTRAENSFNTPAWSPRLLIGNATCAPGAANCAQSFGAAQFTIEEIDDAETPTK